MDKKNTIHTFIFGNLTSPVYLAVQKFYIEQLVTSDFSSLLFQVYCSQMSKVALLIHLFKRVVVVPLSVNDK